jgi:hypothetical protein
MFGTWNSLITKQAVLNIWSNRYIMSRPDFVVAYQEIVCMFVSVRILPRYIGFKGHLQNLVGVNFTICVFATFNTS